MITNIARRRITYFGHQAKTLMRFGWQSAPLSKRGHEWLAQLRNIGVVAIHDPVFESLAVHCREKYFSDDGTKAALATDGIELVPQTDRDFEFIFPLSFKNPNLAPLLFHKELMAVIRSYYGQQPYWRWQPLVHQTKFLENPIPSGDGQFHVDSFRQLSVMVLVSPVRMENTHMEYVKKSQNLWRHFEPGQPLFRDQFEKHLRNPEVFHCIGKPGTAFLFDAGGIHRRVMGMGPQRQAFHASTVLDARLSKISETTQSWKFLEGQPITIRRMFEGLSGNA